MTLRSIRTPIQCLPRGRKRVLLAGLVWASASLVSLGSASPASAHGACHKWVGPTIITPTVWAVPNYWAGSSVPLANTSERICFTQQVHLSGMNITAHSISHQGVVLNNSRVSMLGWDLNPVWQDVSGWVLVGKSAITGFSFIATTPVQVVNGESTISFDACYENLSGATVQVSNAALTLVARPPFDVLGCGPTGLATQTFQVQGRSSVKGLGSAYANVTVSGNASLDGVVGSLTLQCPPAGCSTVSIPSRLSVVGPVNLNGGRISGASLATGNITANAAAKISVDRLKVFAPTGGTSFPGTLDARQAVELGGGLLELAGTSAIAAPVQGSGSSVGVLRNLGSLTLLANNSPTIEGARMENAGQLQISGVVAIPRTDFLNTGTVSIGDGASLQPRTFTTSGTVSLDVNPFTAAGVARVASTGITTLGGTLQIRTPTGPVGPVSWLAIGGQQRVGTFAIVGAPERPVTLTYTLNGVLASVS